MNRRSLIAGALASTMLTSTIFAANVPEGTALADEQVFIYANGDEFSTLDPQKVEDSIGWEISRDLFEGLYNQDAQGNLVPGVALSHEVSGDNLVYTFKLRDNAKWSDGSAVTAADFEYGWKRAVDPELASPYSWFFEVMSVANASEIIAGEKPVDELGVKALDDYTLEVTLSQPLPYFAKTVTAATTFPAPRAVIEAHGDDWIKPENMISNGAYKLSEHVPKERLVRVRNENYWDNEHTVIDRVETLVIGDNVQALTRWKAGELDRTATPAGQYPALSAEFPGEAIAAPQLASYYITLNQSDSGPEALKDVRVRQALSYAIDRDVVVNQVLQGGQTAAYTLTPSLVAGFTPPVPEYSTWDQATRDAKAAELMAEAGYGPDNPLKFEYLYNTDESHEKVGIVLSQMWKQKLGVEATLANQEWKVFLENRGGQNYDVARGGWYGDYNEASTFLDLISSGSNYNDGKYHNDRIDELLAEAKTMQDPSANYSEVETILADEMGVIPLYFYSANMMLKSNVKGWPLENVEQVWYSKDLYKTAE